MVQDGYIKGWRKVLSSSMYQNLSASQRDVFWVCLLLANHASAEWEWEGEIFKCNPGQFVTSLASMRKLCAKDTKTQKIRTALNKLEKWRFLTNISTKTGRLITILNWDTYQTNGNSTNKDVNKDVTKLQQSSNKALTTNKKDKEELKKKKSTGKPSNGKVQVAEFVSMLPKEVETLNAKYGRERTARMVEVLDNYVGANPKKRKYDSHYRAILSWVVAKVLEETPMGKEANGWNI
jgi:hypothetical protein